jgi:hypothetical protein
MLMALPICSIILWAAFNITWWVPDNTDLAARTMMLYILHVVSIFIGSILMFDFI